MACYQICPNDAIRIEKDQLGFNYPIITDSCINCNLCVRTCPNNQGLTALKHIPEKAIAAYSISGDTPENTTSGGIATELYRAFLTNQESAVVYGVTFDRSLQRFGFRRCTSVEEIGMLAGSKYIQPDMYTVYESIKRDLENGRTVLFVGSPCQVMAARLFVSKNAKNFYAVDIVCHGVPSQKMLFDSISGSYGTIQDISFRNKNKYRLKVTFDDGGETEILSGESLFFEGFHNGTIIRQCCHDCQYAEHNRVGDLSLGDFWGLDRSSKFFQKQKESGGVSLILKNTEKGNELLKLIKGAVEYEERSLGEAFSGNPQLNHPINDSRYARIFRKKYPRKDFNKAVCASRTFYRKLTHTKTAKLVKQFMKRR